MGVQSIGATETYAYDHNLLLHGLQAARNRTLRYNSISSKANKINNEIFTYIN